MMNTFNYIFRGRYSQENVRILLFSIKMNFFMNSLTTIGAARVFITASMISSRTATIITKHLRTRANESSAHQTENDSQNKNQNEVLLHQRLFRSEF